MRLFPFFVLLLSPLQGIPQAALYSSADLKKDLAELFRDLNNFHPGVNRYSSPDSLQRVFDQVTGKLQKPATAWGFFRLASELRAAVKCGHTRLRPSDAMQKELEANGHFFPLPVQFAGTRLYARLPDQSVREVLIINDQPVEDVLKIIFSRFPVDGDANAGRYDMITESFWTYYAWLVDFSTPQFELTLRTPGGKETRKIQALDYARVSGLKFYPDKAGDPLLSFEKRRDIGYLSIKTFGSSEINGSGLDYPKFLAEAFTRVEKEKVAKLIIDIRGNGGGDDQYGALLCSYLAKGPFSYFKKVYTRRNNVVSSVNHPCEQLQQPSAHVFTGKAVLLADGRTFSTAADVASIFKSTKRGTIVGRETSGGYEGNTSGRSERMTLTKTKISVIIPQWYYENAVNPLRPPHRGVIPDVTVQKTLQSIEGNMDIEYERAISVLKDQ